MKRDDLGCYLAIISHGRPENIAKMHALVGNATWYVEQQDFEQYAKMTVTKVSSGLCNARNLALEDAFALNLPCLQLSDDLKKIEIAGGKEATREIAFNEIAQYIVGIANSQQNTFLFGVAPTPNAFYYNIKKPFSPRSFIVGDFCLTRPSEPRWDERLPVKEDYDFTLQHIYRYGFAVRCNAVLLTFGHRIKGGGAYAARQLGAEQIAIAYLRQKWPNNIVDNPRRTNEILLRI